LLPSDWPEIAFTGQPESVALRYTFPWLEGTSVAHTSPLGSPASVMSAEAPPTAGLAAMPPTSSGFTKLEGLPSERPSSGLARATLVRFTKSTTSSLA
jgi:hypothetical protein